MPRPSLNPDKAATGSGGSRVEAGFYRVLAAKFQNIKSDFKANSPHLVFDCAVLDKDGDLVKDAENVEISFGFGQKSLESFHPAVGQNRDDDDPEDQGEKPDAEGNTLVCVGEGTAFHSSCGAIVFLTTLAKHGFPKDEVLEKCWAPDFVGLEFELGTETPKNLNEKFGTRLNTRAPRDAKEGDPGITYKIAKRWMNPEYLSGGKAGAKSKAKVNGSAAAVESVPKPTEVEDIIRFCLNRVAEVRPGEKNMVKSKQSLVGFVTSEFAKAKLDNKKLGAVQSKVKDDEYMLGLLPEFGTLGFKDDGTWDGSVIFNA